MTGQGSEGGSFAWERRGLAELWEEIIYVFLRGEYVFLSSIYVFPSPKYVFEEEKYIFLSKKYIFP